MDGVIVAAGEGKRLRPAARNTPKSESAGENWHGGGGESPLRSKA